MCAATRGRGFKGAKFVRKIYSLIGEGSRENSSISSNQFSEGGESPREKFGEKEGEGPEAETLKSLTRSWL